MRLEKVNDTILMDVEINVDTCELCGNVWSRHEIDCDHINILKCEGE